MEINTLTGEKGTQYAMGLVANFQDPKKGDIILTIGKSNISLLYGPAGSLIVILATGSNATCPGSGKISFTGPAQCHCQVFPVMSKSRHRSLRTNPF